MQMKIFAQRVLLAITKIIKKEKEGKQKLENELNDNFPQHQFLENNIEFESRLILFKAKKLYKKFKRDEREVNFSNLSEFRDLVNKHFELTVETDAMYFSQHDSIANLICSTLAVEFSKVKPFIAEYQNPWKTLIYTLESSENPVTKHALTPLKSAIDKNVAIEKKENLLNPWEVILSSDKTKFIEIFSCINTSHEKGFISTSDPQRKQKLTENEIQLIKTHSTDIKTYFEEFSVLDSQNDGIGIARLKRNLKKTLQSSTYKVATIYGVDGEARLVTNLQNAKNYFFTKEDQLDSNPIFDFLIELPPTYWHKAKEIFNFTINDMFTTTEEAIDHLSLLAESKLNWQLFLVTFANNDLQMQNLLKSFLIKYIDPKKWQDMLQSLDMDVSGLFADAFKCLIQLPKQKWAAYGEIVDIKNQRVFNDFVEFIHVIHSLSLQVDKEFFVQTFNISGTQFFNSRQQLIQALRENLSELSIAEWQSMLILLNIKIEELFANREEFIDLILNDLPITKWSEFIEEFDPKNNFNMQTHELFHNSEELLQFMTKIDLVDWPLLFAKFDKTKMLELIFKDDYSKFLLKTGLNKLQYTLEDTLQNRGIVYCLLSMYQHCFEHYGIVGAVANNGYESTVISYQDLLTELQNHLLHTDSIEKFSAKLVAFFSNIKEFLNYISREHWELFAPVLNVKNIFLNDFTKMITFINSFKLDSDKKQLVNVFNIKAKDFYHTREELIKYLIAVLDQLPIDKWKPMFKLLEIPCADVLFRTIAELRNFLNVLPIKHWDLFFKEFAIDKTVWWDELFTANIQLFSLMEKQQDRESWHIFLNQFDEAKLVQLILQEDASEEVLRKSLPNLCAQYQNNTGSIDFCFIEIYWRGYRQKFGEHTTLLGYIPGAACNLKIKEIAVRAYQAFLISGLPRDEEHLDNFLPEYIKIKKIKRTVAEIKSALFEHHCYGYGKESVLCTIIKQSLGMKTAKDNTLSAPVNFATAATKLGVFQQAHENLKTVQTETVQETIQKVQPGC